MSKRGLLINYNTGEQLDTKHTERFRNIKTVEAAEKIISKRVKKNICEAIYNGERLVDNRKPKKDKK